MPSSLSKLPTRAARPVAALPWREAGRFSPLKVAVFAALFLPAVLVVSRYAAGALGARPLTEAIHGIGDWTLRLIFLSVAVTPASRLLFWPRLLLLRRMIGVAAFFYGFAHLALYAADQDFDLAKTAGEILARFYLTIGFSALVILAALAATSTDGMVRRLGARRWRRLHRLIYAGAALAVLHFFLQTKAQAEEPWVMAGLLVWLLGYRVTAGLTGSPPLWSVALLCLAAAAATACGEALYFALSLGVDPLRILAANLATETGVRPGWIVLAISAGLTAAGTLRAVQKRRAKLRLKPS